MLAAYPNAYLNRDKASNGITRFVGIGPSNDEPRRPRVEIISYSGTNVVGIMYP